MSTGIEIVCVEVGGSQDNNFNWYHGAIRLGELDVTSVNDMVTKVIAECGGQLIRRLTVIGHGGAGSQSVGCGQQPDWTGRRALIIDPGPNRLVGSAEDELLRLVGKFAPEAVVSLGGCQVGAGDYGLALLRRVSNVLGGVTVQASENIQHARYSFEGTVIRCKGDTCWVASNKGGIQV